MSPLAMAEADGSRFGEVGAAFGATGGGFGLAGEIEAAFAAEGMIVDCVAAQAEQQKCKAQQQESDE